LNWTIPSLVTFISLLSSSILFGQYNIDHQKIIESAIYLEFRKQGNIEFGTGFVVRDSTESGDFLYLFTAKHVLGKVDSQGKFNLKDSTLHISFRNDIYSENLNTLVINIKSMLDSNLIRFDDEKDISIMLLGKLVDNDLKFPVAAQPDLRLAPTQKGIATIPINYIANIRDLRLGSDVFITGYPKTIGIIKSPQYDYSKPLLRKGLISGIYNKKGTIILDIPAYGGNSGGPVFALDVISRKMKLIGMLIQFIPFVSNSSDYDNSNYAVALSADYIEPLINTFRKK